jgi:hypothetical protein
MIQLKSIRICLADDMQHVGADTQQEHILLALANALLRADHDLFLAWTIQSLPYTDPLEYEVTPLCDDPVSVKDAWTLVDALRQQPQIRLAIPSFLNIEENGIGAG